MGAGRGILKVESPERSSCGSGFVSGNCGSKQGLGGGLPLFVDSGGGRGGGLPLI
jgi:hypothetical protein